MEKQHFSAEDIAAMRDMDFREADREKLKDIRDVQIHTELSKEERIEDFIRQAGNPYCYRYGDYVVKVSFADTDVTLEERMVSYIQSQY